MHGSWPRANATGAIESAWPTPSCREDGWRHTCTTPSHMQKRRVTSHCLAHERWAPFQLHSPRPHEEAMRAVAIAQPMPCAKTTGAIAIAQLRPCAKATGAVAIASPKALCRSDGRRRNCPARALVQRRWALPQNCMAHGLAPTTKHTVRRRQRQTRPRRQKQTRAAREIQASNRLTNQRTSKRTTTKGTTL